MENPQLAESDKIIAIPTLVRMFPEPIRKIIGDLSDMEKTLVGLHSSQRRFARSARLPNYAPGLPMRKRRLLRYARVAPTP